MCPPTVHGPSCTDTARTGAGDHQAPGVCCACAELWCGVVRALSGAHHASVCCVLHRTLLCTVAGNQTVEKCTQNAARVLECAGLRGIHVVKGQGLPLMRPSRICEEIHGESGLDGTTLLPSAKESRNHVVK